MAGHPLPSTSATLAVERLTSFFGRLRGLLGRPPPASGTGVWLSPCKQVHTWGMAYPIDVVHLDAAGIVLAVETLSPWRWGRHVRRAQAVLELRAGEAQRLGLTHGVAVRLLDDQRRVTKK